MPRSEEEIRKKAYAIWESEGRPDGQHDRHWIEAMRDIERSTVKLAPAIVKSKRTSRAKVKSVAAVDVVTTAPRKAGARKPRQS